MDLLKEYSKRYGVKEVVNDYGEHRQTRERSIDDQVGNVHHIGINHDGSYYSVIFGKYTNGDSLVFQIGMLSVI